MLEISANYEKRKGMSEAGRDLVDGKGVERIYQAIMEQLGSTK